MSERQTVLAPESMSFHSDNFSEGKTQKENTQTLSSLKLSPILLPVQYCSQFRQTRTTIAVMDKRST